jgi:hypothetical protein
VTADEQRNVALRALAKEIAEKTGGPYTERELAEAREWMPSASTVARVHTV